MERSRTKQLRTHRAYQVAILDVLADGQVHPRQDLQQAGLKACDPVESLGAYQRANPEREQELQRMKGEERIGEALRQQVEGSKMLVSKALSHLVDRKLMEAVDFDERGRRLNYRITEKGEAFRVNPPPPSRRENPVSRKKKQVMPQDQKPCFFCEEMLYPTDRSIWRWGPMWYRRDRTSESGKVRQTRAPGRVTRYAHNACVIEHYGKWGLA